MTINFITNDEFRALAPDVDLSAYSETTISGFINSATNQAEGYLGYTLPFEQVEETIEAYVDADSDLVIFPTKKPIQTFNSLSITKGSFTANVNLTSGTQNLYNISNAKDRVTIPGSTITLSSVNIIDFTGLRNTKFFVKINYGGGYYMYDRPQDIIEAIVLFSRDKFSRTANPYGASRMSQGSVSIDYAQRKGKSDLVTDAESILLGYKSVVNF